MLLLFPVTSKLPHASQWAVELPEMEKRRAGLSADLRLWLVMEECNLELLPGSFYLEPQVPLGHLSRKFLVPLLKEFIQRRDQMKTVDRMR